MKQLPTGISNKIANMGIVCAMMVVLIHLHCPESSASIAFVRRLLPNGVCAMAVPFFFIASGYLLAGHIGEAGWWRKALAKRIRTLLVPMLIWSVLWMAYEILLPLMANLAHGCDLSRNLPAVTWVEVLRLAGLHPFHEPYLGVLWFVRMLFALVVFSPLLKYLATPIGVLALYVLQLCLGPGLGNTPPPLRFTLLKGFFPICGAAFFTLGMMLRRDGCSLDVPKKAGVVCLALSLVCIAVVSWFFPSGRVMAYAGWVVVPVLIVGVWSVCPTKRFPGILVSAAFPVYMMHMFSNAAIEMVMFRGHVTVVKYGLSWLLSVAACLLLAWMLRKFLPRFSATAFGGRNA